jgi:hypothetical protein
VNHYSFHIMDPDWGHMVIKMSGHPPFGAQVTPWRPHPAGSLSPLWPRGYPR